MDNLNWSFIITSMNGILKNMNLKKLKIKRFLINKLTKKIANIYKN